MGSKQDNVDGGGKNYFRFRVDEFQQSMKETFLDA